MVEALIDRRRASTVRYRRSTERGRSRGDLHLNAEREAPSRAFERDPVDPSPQNQHGEAPANAGVEP